jgi:translation elongation factor P/translation initiation factor 5A
MAVKLEQLKAGMYVRTAGGVCRVVRVPVKRGRVWGADLIRMRSGNYALDADGKPYEVLSAYSQHYPEYLINEIVEGP